MEAAVLEIVQRQAVDRHICGVIEVEDEMQAVAEGRRAARKVGAVIAVRRIIGPRLATIGRREGYPTGNAGAAVAILDWRWEAVAAGADVCG